MNRGDPLKNVNNTSNTSLPPTFASGGSQHSLHGRLEVRPSPPRRFFNFLATIPGVGRPIQWILGKIDQWFPEKVKKATSKPLLTTSSEDPLNFLSTLSQPLQINPDVPSMSPLQIGKSTDAKYPQMEAKSPEELLKKFEKLVFHAKKQIEDDLRISFPLSNPLKNPMYEGFSEQMQKNLNPLYQNSKPKTNLTFGEVEEQIHKHRKLLDKMSNNAQWDTPFKLECYYIN